MFTFCTFYQQKKVIIMWICECQVKSKASCTAGCSLCDAFPRFTFFDFPSAQYDVDEISGVRLSCRPVFVSADLSSAPYWANDPIPVSHLYFQHNTDNCVLVKSSSDIAINQSWKWLIEENKNSTVARQNPELSLCEHHHSVNWSHEINLFTNNILTTKEKNP